MGMEGKDWGHGGISVIGRQATGKIQVELWFWKCEPMSAACKFSGPTQICIRTSGDGTQNLF